MVSDDIVTRLRHIHMELTVDDYDDVITEAADEIERLRAELERKSDYAERRDALAKERLIECNRLRAEVAQLESVWTFINIWKSRYESERALADQLADALRDAHGTATRHAVCWCSTDSEYPADCDSTRALAAYEAARKEEQ